MVSHPEPAGDPDRRARVEGWVRAARNGDSDAFGQLISEFSPLLWHVARAAGLDSHDAEDVVQTTWEQLVKHLHRIHTPTQLCAWLVQTTRREAWSVRGAGRRQVVLDQDWLDAVIEPAPGAEDLALTNDWCRELWKALGQLDGRCQELLRIVAFVSRPDYEAVATVLGIKQGSVGPTRMRCLAKLRALLEPPRKETR